VLHELKLTAVEAERVLLPDGEAKIGEGIRITVHGPSFPQRALIPELWIGKLRAELVSISADGHSLRGYLRELPPDRATVVVRYGASQSGTLRRAFRRRRVRPLPREC
jgi:hypothetical protein